MNIAIFNGFNFHYEMFGYIIYFCKISNHNLTIYCHQINDLGYFNFYNAEFNDYSIQYKNLELFENEKINFDFIFLITDDDPYFTPLKI